MDVNADGVLIPAFARMTESVRMTTIRHSPTPNKELA